MNPDEASKAQPTSIATVPNAIRATDFIGHLVG
jgi:hypothetical protein